MSSHFLHYFSSDPFHTCSNEDMHKSLDEFEIGPDPTTGFRGNRYCYNLEKRCCHFFSVVLDGSLFILTGNDDIHKSLDELEIQPDPTMDHSDSCP